MKKFLFLDDTQIRHDIFDKICQNLDAEVWHCFNVEQAIKRLNHIVFDCAFLDHDLCEHEDGDGWVVAKYIALHMAREQQPKNVVIHSWNNTGALHMENILRSNGYLNVKRVEFGSERLDNY